MRHIIAKLLAAALLLCGCAQTKAQNDMKNGLDGNWPVGSLNTAYAKYFIGNSHLASLAEGEGKLPVHNVTFEPGCRNNWHIHHKGGQILIVVSGKGWYQEWGKPARELKVGDVVDIPAEVKHWHGAAADSWFQHIALSVPAEGASTEWLESVDDAYYSALVPGESKSLVAYFSATGTTAQAAKDLAKATGSAIYEIVPKEKYTSADLDWRNDRSRSTLEMKDPASRPELRSTLPSVKDYDTIYLGFPIWWYTAPRIINTFLESLDLDGKTIVLFATSGGSDLGDTAASLQGSAKGARIVSGGLLNGRKSEEELKAWAQNAK